MHVMVNAKCLRIGTLRLCLALMLGLLAVPGYIVAPVLFAKAGTVSMAGMLAGEVFHVTNMGLILLSVVVIALWLRMRSRGMEAGRLRWSLLLLVTALIITNEYGISPILADLKAQVGSMDLVSKDDPVRQQFGVWHGVSAVLHLISALAAAAMVALGPTGSGKSCSS